MIIRTELGKLLQTENLPENIEPCFCCKCDCRLGWYDTDFGEQSVAYCDDCAADLMD